MNYRVFVLCIGMAVATAFGDAVRDHDIVVDDYFTLDHIASCQVSPQGRHVAFSVLRWDKDLDRRNTDLWLVERATQVVRRLTFDPAAEHGVTWSPDGRTLYFQAAYRRAGETTPPYDGSAQVWRLTLAGGEPTAVTRVKDGINSYRLSANGGAVYYITDRRHVDEAWSELRNEFSDLSYAHGVTEFSTLWRLDLHTWRCRQVLAEDRVIRDWDVAADESRVAMITTPDGHLVTHEGRSRVDVCETGSGTVTPATPDGSRADHPSPFGWVEGLRFAADGGALAFTVSFDGYPTRVYAAEWTGERSTLRELPRPAGVSIAGGSTHWRGAQRELLVRGERHGRSRLYQIADVVSGGQGPVSELTPGDVTVTASSASIDGQHMVVVSGGIDHAGDLFAVRPDGSYQRLTRINPQMDTWKLPQMSIVKWTGAGATVEGILELPPDYRPGQRVPLVVEIHGGPTAASWYRFRLWIYGRTLLPARGIAVLSPNYRGSTGYGDAFMVDLVGRENDIDVQDILSGVDAMVERGIADPERLGVMGWSNGGYLTNCLITRTPRFKAASSGAGVLDQVIQWGTEDTPGHVVNFMQGLPWDRPDAYRKGSPIYGLGKVRTPTLIHVGEHDPRVPPAHARALYRALRHYVDVPTELIVYPGAGHGLTTYTHRKAKIAWDLAWFEKYLGTPQEHAGR